MDRTLQRSRSERMVFGVCAGLAHYFDLDVTLTRLIFVVLAFASGVGVVAYIILAIVVPEEGEPLPTVRENSGAGEEARDVLSEPVPGNAPPRGVGHVHRGQPSLAALILILIGLLLLMNNLGLFWWLDWGRTWPVLLIVIGLFILLKRTR